MAQSKVSPMLSTMPPHILQEIVKNTDIGTKFVLRKIKPLRKTVQTEMIRLYSICVIYKDEHNAQVRITVKREMQLETDVFEYKQFVEGCHIKKGDFSKFIANGNINELITTDLSLFMANPLITIEHLWFEHEVSFNDDPIGFSLSTLLGNIEETILKKRSQTLDVENLSVLKTRHRADILKILPHVTPGVLRLLHCSADEGAIDVIPLTRLPHFPHLESLRGTYENDTVDMWKRFSSMSTYSEYNTADILVLIQAALDHGEEFDSYIFNVDQEFNTASLEELVSRFAGSGSVKDHLKYIPMANGSDMLVIQILFEGRLKMEKLDRRTFNFMINP